jgi:hypothetical protein
MMAADEGNGWNPGFPSNRADFGCGDHEQGVLVLVCPRPVWGKAGRVCACKGEGVLLACYAPSGQPGLESASAGR